MDDLPMAVWQTCVHTAAFEEDLSVTRQWFMA